MKTLIALSLVSMFLMTACSPQDPAVLTRDEKSREASRRSRSGGGNSGQSTVGGAPGVPPLADAATAIYLLDRQSEVIQFLALGGLLTEARERLSLQSCVRLTEVPRSATTHQVLLDFSQCARKVTPQFLSQNGRISMEITLDESRKMSALKVSTAELNDPGLTAFAMTLSKDKIRDRAEIRDQLKIEAVRVSTEPLRFRLVEAQSLSKVVVSARNLQTYSITTMTSGDVEFVTENGQTVARHALRSELNWVSEIAGAKNSPYFRTSLIPKNGTVNTESLEVCGGRQGESMIKFSYRPDQSRNNDPVVYDAESVTLISAKNPDRKSRLATSPCDKRAGGLNGWFVVDWSQLFLF